MKKFFGRVAEVLGFNKNTKYVNNYIREANVRSAIFMSAVIIILELWLIFRQTQKYLHHNLK